MPLVFQNGYAFDQQVLRKHRLIKAFLPTGDMLYQHHARYPELPHKLEYQGAMYTPFAYWKDEGKTGEEGENAPDPQLWKYCGRDTQGQMLAHENHNAALAKNPIQQKVYTRFLRLAELGARMTWEGVRIDGKQRAWWSKRLREKLATHREAIDKIATKHHIELFSDPDKEGRIKFSKKQLRKLFFSALKLPVIGLTDTGLPSIDKGNIAEMQKLATSKEQLNLISEYLAYSAAEKLNSNYAAGLPVLPDGRVHPLWKPALAETGRWKCARPNAMNVPKRMRDMWLPDEGCVWIEADGNQIEMRVMGIVARCKHINAAYARGEDIHRTNTKAIFLLTNEQLDTLKKNEPMVYTRFRVIAKKTGYGSSYGVTALGLLGQLRQATDDEGNFVCPDIELGEVEAALNAWRKVTPEIEQLKQQQLAHYHTEGGVPSMIEGWWRWYPGGAKPTEIINDTCQRTTAELMNRNILPLDEQLQKDRLGQIRVQCHDSVLVNVKKAKTDKVAKIVQKHMEAPVPIRVYGSVEEHSLPFDLEIKDRWSKLNH